MTGYWLPDYGCFGCLFQLMLGNKTVGCCSGQSNNIRDSGKIGKDITDLSFPAFRRGDLESKGPLL
jgi:hypothetical protein